LWNSCLFVKVGFVFLASICPGTSLINLLGF
jgi:hypothetical protein